MRFRQGPDVWPEVRLLAPENILSDIQTKACEVELEMFVGQEPEIEFELCGVKWVWKALDQTLNCQGYKMKIPTEKEDCICISTGTWQFRNYMQTERMQCS